MTDGERAPSESLDLIGRTAELDFLAECLATPRLSRATMVLVRGARGIGKSSLLHAAQRDLRERGATVLHATAGDPGVPYGVVRDLFEPLGQAAEWWTRRGPEDTFIVLNGLLRLAVDLMTTAPLVLLVDDAPAADEVSLRWLDFLMRRSAGLPLLVVLTQRLNPSGPGSAQVADMAAENSAATMHLGPLPRKDIAEFVARTMGCIPRGSFVDACTRMFDGNPLLLLALLDEMRAREIRPDEGGAAQVVTVGREVLVELARAYLVCHPPHVGAVARALAVLDGARTTALGVLCDLSDAKVARALEILQRDEMLTTDSRALSHRETGRAVLAGLSAEEANDLRQRAATVLEDQGAPSEEVARLLMALPSLPEPWMRRALRRAADEACAGKTNPTGIQSAAAGSYTPVTDAAGYLVRILDSNPDDIETLTRLADLVAATDPAAALGYLTNAIGHADDVRVRVGLASRFGLLALGARRASAALRILDRTLTEFDAQLGSRPVISDLELRGQAQVVLTMAGLSEEGTTGKILLRRRDLPGLEREHHRGDSTSSCLLVSGLSAYTSMLAGRDASAVAEHARRSLSFGGLVAHPLVIASASALRYAGEPGEALIALSKLLTSTRGGPPGARGIVLAGRATVLEEMGELAEAAADAQTAIAEVAGLESFYEQAVAPQVRLASVLVKMREPQRAAALLEQTRWPHFGWVYPYAAMTSAEIRRLDGDTEGALTILRDCGRRLTGAGVRNPVFAPWWLEAACLLAELGRYSEATEMAEHGDEGARQWGTAESTGMALVARGVATPGPCGLDLLTDAVEVLGETPARLSHARAEYLLGRALLHTDDAKGARTHLRNAIALAVRCGYLTLGTCARELLVAAGGRMRKLSGRPAEALSDTEHRVAELAAAGASNREIAETLFVTLRTVETHLSSIYRKLRVGLRADLPAALDSRPGSRGESA